jgi:hypothetical protein
MELSRLQVLHYWIELDKEYTFALSLNPNYINIQELNRQMFLTLLFSQKNQEFIFSMRKVDELNNLIPTLTSLKEIEEITIQKEKIGDLIMFHITPPDYFPHSLEEMIVYIEKIENHQKMLNIPF